MIIWIHKILCFYNTTTLKKFIVYEFRNYWNSLIRIKAIIFNNIINCIKNYNSD